MDDLEFGFALIDKASAPAARIHRSLDTLDKDLKQLDRATGRDQFGRFTAGAKDASVATVAFGTTIGGVMTNVATAVGHAALSMVKLGAAAVLNFGQAAVGAAVFREKTELALEMLRHGEDGARQLDRIKQIALELGTPFEETAKSFQKLAAMQFSQADAERFFLRMQDLKAVGADAEQTGRALLAITQIKATGKLQGDELLQLADAGVSVELVMQELAKATGKTVAEVMALKEAGKISADLALDAIDKAIGKKTGASVAGDAGRKFANETIAGMSDRLSNMGGVLRDDVGQALMPALLAMKPLLDDMFRGAQSPEFKAFLSTVGKAVGEVVTGLLELRPILADVFAGLTGKDAQVVILEVARAFRSILEAVREAWPTVKAFLGGMGDGLGESFKAAGAVADGLAKAFGDGKDVDMKKLGEAARDIGKAFGVMAAAVLFVVGAFGLFIAAGVQLNAWLLSLKTDVDNFIKSLADGGKTAVLGFIDGILVGLAAGKERISAAIAGLGFGSLTTLYNVLRIGSPSAETEWIAQMMGAGLSRGALGAIPGVESSMGKLGGAALGALPMSPPMPEDPIRIPSPRANSSSIRGDTNLSVTQNQSINGARDPKETGKAAGERARHALANELERFAAELGN